MRENRVILHIDMNNFYASVECSLDPALRPYPVAVCGSEEERHGIVLAKNYQAKAYGVKTGESIREAKEKCGNLVIVPPHYGEYMKYSLMAREIYGRYTDLIEPYGMDEVWADCTGSVRMFGDGETIANEIRETVKRELGLTVSVGVSFNKVFAKLGSDMKKPDAVTVISRDGFREKIWGLPASDMLGVGRAAERQLAACGVHTIGDLARLPDETLRHKFGKIGVILWGCANGLDCSPVTVRDIEALDKSAGHGMTALSDLENDAEVWPFFLELSQELGHRLRVFRKKAHAISIFVKDRELFCRQWQAPLPMPTQSASVIAEHAFALFCRSYDWHKPIRALTVRAIGLESAGGPTQFSLFDDPCRLEKTEHREEAVEEIRRRFGEMSIYPAILMHIPKYPDHDNPKIQMPNGTGL